MCILVVRHKPDHASMWVKDPTQRGAGPEIISTEAMEKIREKLSKRGKDCHLPVVNMSENLFCVRHDPSNTSDRDKGCCFSAEVTTPAFVIPEGSASTIHKTWSGWSAFTARGAARPLMTLSLCDRHTINGQTQNNRTPVSGKYLLHVLFMGLAS